jgi:hypothetical protein
MGLQASRNCPFSGENEMCGDSSVHSVDDIHFVRCRAAVDIFCAICLLSFVVWLVSSLLSTVSGRN